MAGASGDVTLAELADDPHPHLARLRATAPVTRVPALGGWLVTSRAGAVAVMRDPTTFTVDDARFSTAQVVGRSMLSTDGDEHARHREPFVGPFGPRAVESRFDPFIGETVERLLSVIEGSRGRTAELRGQLAGPLAAAVVADALGLDGADDALVERLLGWYRDIVSSVTAVAAGGAPTSAGTTAMATLRRALAHLVDVGHGSVLAEARRRSDLSEDDVVADAAVIMFGAIETTEGMILNALWYVLRDAAARDELARHPELMPAAIEESLRLEPAAAVVDRYATRDIEVGGALIGTGDLVVVSLAGANRDPDEFPDPDRFDLRRPNVRRQLSFAVGSHACIGMDLARHEARAAVAGVLTRFPTLALDADAPPPTGLVFRKPARLPVRW